MLELHPGSTRSGGTSFASFLAGRMKVKHSRMKWITIVAALASMMVLATAGCKKKAAPAPPPPPPPPQPTASLTANPNSIQRGESTTLTWQTTNATDVTLQGIGAVKASGSQQVTPTESTTYRLIGEGRRRDAGSHGPGHGHAAAGAAADRRPLPATRSCSTRTSRTSSSTTTSRTSVRTRSRRSWPTRAFLQQHPNIRFTIEGHCDERGSTEYNLGSGRQPRQRGQATSWCSRG